MILLRHKIINQNSDISLRPVQHQRLSSENLHRRIDTGNESLTGCLLITAAAVELPSGKKSPDLLKFKGCIQLVRINTIIFDRIGIPDNFHMLQSRQGAVHLMLHILRK